MQNNVEKLSATIARIKAEILPQFGGDDEYPAGVFRERWEHDLRRAEAAVSARDEYAAMELYSELSRYWLVQVRTGIEHCAREQAGQQVVNGMQRRNAG